MFQGQSAKKYLILKFARTIFGILSAGINNLTQGSFSNISMFPSGIIPDRVMNCFCWNFGYQIPGLIACTNLVGIDESWDIKNKG